ncbi:MAG TPA: alkaline phosphatase family protein [Terriglobales bacterium]|nr:alkaline phosphatase family protein [Terriglobales bacterium]
MRLLSHMRHVLHQGAALTTIAALLGSSLQAATGQQQDYATTTPIKHVVVIFQENVSFDHYFATYPNAANTDGTPFYTAKETPTVNGLDESLLAPNNPNSVQPFRFSHEQYETNSQDHGYTHEQQAFDHGLMDMFVEKTGHGSGPSGEPGGQVMGYYDGNTVTAMWNYAQTFAMNDNSYSTGFGPSTVGALNLVSGQTHGFATTSPEVSAFGSVFSDPQPTGDICDTRDNTTSTDTKNRNIGDLLNDKGVTWGWFQGGFREAPGKATCTVQHKNRAGVISNDYIPHHEPFQYYASTANPAHLPPSSVASIGYTDQANHQYDLTDFWAAVDAGNMPAVSFLKAQAYQDGHAGYSDPLDEQEFLVNTINRLERTPFWHDTAVIIAYDDSDGWYDHAMSPIVNQSQDATLDALRGADCGVQRADPQHTLGGYQDRCGYGPRQPLLVISPYAKSNFVDHTVTDQTSILRFIEDNWQTGKIGNFSMDTKAGTLLNMFAFAPEGPVGGANKLFLDPITGAKGGGSDQQ